MVLALTLIFLALFSITGAWLMSRLYMWKNRNPATGAIIGGVSGIFPVLLVIVVVVALFSPKLKPGARGYVATNKKDPSEMPVAKRLKDLKDLADRGLIDDEEYRATKAQILGQV